jgi:PKHD-type hydroxylase
MTENTEVPKPQWLMWEAGFSEEECDMILEMCEALPTQEATTFGGHSSGGRETQIRWAHENEQFKSLFDKVREFCHIANDRWHTNLTHLPPLQFTEYNDVGSHYDWHHDINWSRDNGMHRKISVVVQLTDPEEYEGGEFSFRYLPNPEQETMKKRGTVLVFLSYHYHMVSPIESGNRTSLVGWYEGPEWI